MAKRRFYRCISCGHIQEDAEEMQVKCEECGDYEWELEREEEDDEIQDD